MVANDPAPTANPYDYEESIGAGADADFFIVYDPMKMAKDTLNTDPRMGQFRPFREGNFIAGVDENFNECRAKTYLGGRGGG